MVQEKGTMNKFKFLLTCSNEQDDDFIKNIDKRMVMFLTNEEYYALLLQINHRLILFTQN